MEKQKFDPMAMPDISEKFQKVCKKLKKEVI